MKPAARATYAVPAAAILLSVTSHTMAAGLVEMPPRAPRAAVAQDVGLTRISVEYRSPAVRGHQIWGERVAFDEPWTTGDSPQATIGFSRDVTVAGVPVPAGTYALVATPAASTWTFALETKGEVPDHVPGQRAIRVQVPVGRGEPRERLRFVFSTFTASSAELDLEWENVRVALPIGVDTDGQILSAIAELDRRDASLARDYTQAAKFLLSKKASDTDREKGRVYLARAEALAGAPRAPLEPGPQVAEPKSVEPERKVAVPPPKHAAEASKDGPTTAPAGPGVPGSLIATSTYSSQLPAATERGAPQPHIRATHAPGAAEIGPVVSKGRPAIQACYQRALRKDPSLANGKLAVSITIGTSGMVKAVEVRAPEALRPVEACVKEAISRWAFPPSPEPYATELPFVLDRRD